MDNQIVQISGRIKFNFDNNFCDYHDMFFFIKPSEYEQSIRMESKPLVSALF